MKEFNYQVRSEVFGFAGEMESVLKKNDHKGGWKECDIEYLRHRLVEEMGEYFAEARNPQTTPERQRKELVDIANFCMMLWDRS